MKKYRIAIPEIDQSMKHYVNAVAAAGMEPVVVSVASAQKTDVLGSDFLEYSKLKVEDFDGLLVPGGVDIHPARYHRENQGSVGISEDLDEFQLDILDRFIKTEKPVLGICRGHQLINVYFGGTLIQHLDTTWRHAHEPGEPDKVHNCQAKEGSWLARVYGCQFSHNSSHHQAVEQPGNGLVIDSLCQEDGAVEGMHHETLPVITVQWHPERTCLEFESSETVNGLGVFAYFKEMLAGVN